jgi:hypothetical protein
MQATSEISVLQLSLSGPHVTGISDGRRFLMDAEHRQKVVRIDEDTFILWLPPYLGLSPSLKVNLENLNFIQEIS